MSNFFNLNDLANAQADAAQESETRRAAQTFWNAYRGFSHLYWTAFKKQTKGYIARLKQNGDWSQFVTDGEVNWEAFNKFRAESFFENYNQTYGQKGDTLKSYQAGIRKICKVLLTEPAFAQIRQTLGDPEDSPSLLIQLAEIAEGVREAKRAKKDQLSLREDLVGDTPF